MKNKSSFFEDFIFRKTNGISRFTQDSPVFPEVWAQYFLINKKERVDLIFTPNRKYTASDLLINLRKGLREFSPKSKFLRNPPKWSLATSGETIAAKLTFEELIHVALPLTSWWNNYLWKKNDLKASEQKSWFIEIVKAITWYQDNKKESGKSTEDLQKILMSGDYKSGVKQNDFKRHASTDSETPIWAISWNRKASVSLYKSNKTIKSEPSRRLFDIDGSGITWAVIDSGIDATHPGFRRLDKSTYQIYPTPFERGDRSPNKTRIVATYDFTKLRDIMKNMEGVVLNSDPQTKSVFKNKVKNEAITITSNNSNEQLSSKQINTNLNDLARALKNGRDLDWSILAPLLRIPHNSIDDYITPSHPHGTHVAGILGGDMSLKEGNTDRTLVGVCPGIELYDLRVFDQNGVGDEFSILAALQFIRWLNRQKDKPIIHGVNMSMSLIHMVKNYACGKTPICDECNRVVGQGAVVVAAAGNAGRSVYMADTGRSEEGYRDVSITDPGNAENVITVGATHRNKPHSYGVSYFSSRGPTGDGRLKPDIVAPGEKIVSLYPEEKEERLDGTSMAAPHVSGAAALLLCKNRELIGSPLKIKEILCSTATDLGREKYFQGAGLVDILRALQSI